MAQARRPGGFRPLEEVAAAAGALLPRTFRGRHLRALAAWRAAVGAQLQRSTRVARLDGALMTVQVTDEAHRDSLRRLEGEILGRIRRNMGRDAPQRMRFEIDPGFWRPDRAPKPRSTSGAGPWRLAEPRSGIPGDDGEFPPGPPPSLSGPEVPEGGGLAAGDVGSIPDPQVRRRLLEVANRYLARTAQRGSRRR